MNELAAQRPIAATDRVSDVLARDESLVEVFARAAPHFSKLRSRTMRRVMARLVTVEQAARMAGVRTDVLLHDLNAALGLASANGSGTSSSPSAPAPRESDDDDVPALGTARTGAGRPRDAAEAELDVRDDLRTGREPFSRIMAAIGLLAPHDVLHLRTTFEPLPLYAVLEKRGFAHESLSRADDDWSVWFWRATQRVGVGRATTSDAALPTEHPPGIETRVGADRNTVWLDVRGMEPPEPLVRTLAALETLPDDHTLVQVNVRVPQFLLPVLAERGYACEIDESHSGYVLVEIWRAA